MRFVNISLILSACFGVGMACNMSGDWVNEKGSNLTIIVDGASGQVSGSFTTAVGKASGVVGVKKRIIGWANSTTNLISFAVMYSESTVVFTGQYYAKALNSSTWELLWTSWILKSKVESCKDHWKNNTVGEDRFTRIGSGQGFEIGPCRSNEAQVLSC